MNTNKNPTPIVQVISFSFLSVSIFNGKKFDIIYHCDVISHFFDSIAEFKKMHQVMNNGGLLIFETGNLGEMDEKYFKHIQRFQYPGHLFFFNVENLQTLLRETGFEIIKIQRYSILPQLIMMKGLFFLKMALGKRR